MTRISQSRSFSLDQIAARYAAFGLLVCEPPYTERGFMIFDVDKNGYTIRTTIVERADLPADIAAQCEALDGYWPNQVKLP